MRWMLLSGVHFQSRDLDRVRRTAQWIIAEAERSRVSRVVICGDLLTSRTMHPTHVVSACYRFISDLSDIVPRVNIILGNHDLAYRRDYQTTALEALNMKTLAPHVSIHSVIDRQVWDGRKVLLLPFREEQSDLTDAVAAISPDEASETVAFAHLAINKAILQRYTPHTNNSITYRGLTGPDHFASLARTFTGHFHSHQTITQHNILSNGFDLRGSITYLGSPLQLSWGDLNDDERGVVLFDPQTLHHELRINPYAIGYTIVDVERVLKNKVQQDAVEDKHVMLLGELNHHNYITARHSLLSLGARSVREWNQSNYTLGSKRRPLENLGSSVPTSDIAVQPLEDLRNDGLRSNPCAQPEIRIIDIDEEARQYVETVDLDASLLSRRDELLRVGRNIIQDSRTITHEDEEAGVNYHDFMNRSFHPAVATASSHLKNTYSNVFIAEPHTLTITNFLGVQRVITIDFRHDFPRGLTLLVGDDGSGKSTLGQAMVWCQFGRCVRAGLSADGVVNDTIGMNCSVTLEFTNGYAITRYRKHNVHQNRVVITLHGEPQPQFERPDARSTQAAINDLLRTDYETYVRTVVVSHESAASFLSLTPIQRRDMVEASLGMPDNWGCIANMLLKKIDTEVTQVRKNLDGVGRMMKDSKRRIEQLQETQKRLQNEALKAVASLGAACRHQAAKAKRFEQQAHQAKPTFPRIDPRIKIFTLQKHVRAEQENLDKLRAFYAELQIQSSIEDVGWFESLHERVRQKLKATKEAHATGPRRPLQRRKRIFLSYLSIAIRCYVSFFRNPEYAHRQATMGNVDGQIDEGMSRLKALKSEGNRAINHALTMSEKTVRFAQHTIIRQKLQQQEREELRRQVTMKKHGAAIYDNFVEDESKYMRHLQSKHDLLVDNLRKLTDDRELFEFWAFALSKGTDIARPVISFGAKAKRSINFREHLLLKSISELNSLVPQILTVLYNDAQLSNIATAMLRSIFDTDSDSKSTFSSVLDSKLAINSSNAYGKHSRGDREQVDLALFLALLHLARAKSAHHAHYVLIDGVFDKLDNTGQAAAFKWLSVMSQMTVGWVMVITRSQFLVERDVGHGSAKVLVVRTNVGQEGTELYVNGRKIGRK
ncbi:hypothetical protein FPOAC2_10448 [Fusarium poae]|uniref:hypothetical protein n=1 Tax=Fusarium poae TaxID=36050 RepID=UPI001CE7B821|nr:hypothetical protein FPOAC1_010165 [Fusarium poae]KAG8665370.1 hypothetical protein FPOAC1_010165 [Fusarium poae]